MTGMPATSAHGPLADAVQWLALLITGTAGTAVAVIAIAWLGFMMLGGRLPVRTGLRMVIGCFILFGAPMIAVGLVAASRSVGVQPSDQRAPPIPTPVTPPVTPPVKPPVFDPYAGASVPNQ